MKIDVLNYNIGLTKTLILGKWNESYDYKINLDTMDSFLNLGEERRKGEYEKVEGKNNSFQERQHTKDV